MTGADTPRRETGERLMNDEPMVVDNVTGGRFELEVDGHLAVLVYRRTHGRMVLIRTVVPPEIEGHGVGGRLVRAAVEDAAQDDLAVATMCPFAADWIRCHPDIAGLVRIESPADAKPGSEPPGAQSTRTG